MLIASVLALLNYAVNFLGTRLGRTPGFDLIPFCVMVIAWSGENLFLGTGLILASYVAADWSRVSHLTTMVPTVLILSILALFIQNGFLLLILYHLMNAAVAYVLGIFGTRYMTFMVVHLIINGIALQIYGLAAG